MTSLVANLTTNFQLLVAKLDNFHVLAPGLDAISCSVLGQY